MGVEWQNDHAEKCGLIRSIGVGIARKKGAQTQSAPPFTQANAINGADSIGSSWT